MRLGPERARSTLAGAECDQLPVGVRPVRAVGSPRSVNL
jgi:hypothetical protein